MSQEKKQLAAESAKALAKSIEQGSEDNKDVVISIIGNPDEDVHGAVAGSPQAIIFALVIMAEENPEFAKMLRLTVEYLNEQKAKDPLQGILDKLSPVLKDLIKDVGGPNCPCPKCTARRKAQAEFAKTVKPTDIN